MNNKIESNVAARPTLNTMTHLDRGVVQKLYEMMYLHGPGNGTLLSLPFDQLIEHGPVHRMKGEGIGDPRSVIQLANQGKFSAIVLHRGLAKKYQNELKPDLPLIFKVDGHISAGKESDSPIQGTFASIQEGLRLGASAIGMSFYPGSERTTEDMERLGKLIEKSHRYGLPVVMWSYPRGPDVNKTQRDSLYWTHYAVAVAESLGADIVKTKFPAVVKQDYKGGYEKMLKAHKIKDAVKYLDYEPKSLDDPLTHEQHVYRMKLLVDAAPRTYVIVSGGPKIKDDPKKGLLNTTRIAMDSGAEGRIIGRNFWGVPLDEGLKLSDAVARVMMEPQYNRKLSRKCSAIFYA